MSVLPNSHEVLLRHVGRLRGQVALLGVQDPALLSRLAVTGLAMTEHAGVHRSLSGAAGWRAAFGYDDPTLQAACYDSLVVFLPKARAELELRLALAFWLARAGAEVLLVGEKKEGIAGAVKHFRARAPSAVKVDSARHCQVWSAQVAVPLAAFDLADWLSWTPLAYRGVSLNIAGLPGVFSLGELDDGTALLLDSFAERPLVAPRVLDFACGAGVIGAWLQASARAEGREVPVDGVDVQAQAVRCARETYARNGGQGTILASDGLSGVSGRWPAVVSNPPFHSGVKTDTSMTEHFLAQVSEHLQPGGELRLVANSFLPYETLMARHVGPVERLAGDRRFTVYRAVRT